MKRSLHNTSKAAVRLRTAALRWAKLGPSEDDHDRKGAAANAALLRAALAYAAFVEPNRGPLHRQFDELRRDLGLKSPLRVRKTTRRQDGECNFCPNTDQEVFEIGSSTRTLKIRMCRGCCATLLGALKR